jgi:alpha-L-rhamnosidase
MNFTLICLVALVMSTQAADTSVTGLRCEDRVDPMGLDEPAPRFTWTISSTQRGWMQSACRVLVASDAQCLVRDEGDLWDSGKVVGDASALVYSGKALAARQECRVGLEPSRPFRDGFAGRSGLGWRVDRPRE